MRTWILQTDENMDPNRWENGSKQKETLIQIYGNMYPNRWNIEVKRMDLAQTFGNMEHNRIEPKLIQ